MHLNLIALLVVIIIILGSILILYKQTRAKDLISFLFIIYLVFLSYIVTSYQPSYLDSNFTLFKEICRYDIHSRLFIKNIIGNILLFIPLGTFITYKLEIKHFYIIIIISLYFSVCIEIIQLLIGRIFDIDDILLNVFGSLIGYLVYKILNQFMCKILKK